MRLMILLRFFMCMLPIVLNGMENSSLFDALRRDDIALLRDLFNQGLSPLVIDKEGNSLLHHAARTNAVACVPLIFECADYKINAELQNRAGDTPLHIAARYNAVEFAKALFAARQALFVNVRNKQHETPLYGAVDAHAVSFIKVLYDLCGFVPVGQQAYDQRSKVDTNARNKLHRGATALHVAIEQNDRDLVKLLLDHGADPAVDVSRYDVMYTMPPPLFVAVKCKLPDIAEELLQHGAPIDQVDRHGDTPLHAAAQYDADTLIPVLLADGASCDALDHDSETPLERARAFKSDRVIALLESLSELPSSHPFDSLPPSSSFACGEVYRTMSEPLLAMSFQTSVQ